MDEKNDGLKEDEYLQALAEEQAEFYGDGIDPTQPSTSNTYRNEKFQYAQPAPPPNPNKSRLRAQRQTSKAISDAAKKNGMQTVDRSGASFVVPITMQAHPTQLNDRVLAEKDDILSQTTALPYCCQCHSIFKTWRGFEYHVLQIHIKYRPFRCFHCQKDSFYTEEEGRFHASTTHPGDDLLLFKEFDPAKEIAAQQAFKQIFMMCRDGPNVTQERVYEWEKEASREIMKFHFLKFKRPIVVTKKLPVVSKEAQTEYTSIRMLVPTLGPDADLQQTPPIYQSSVTMAGYRLTSTPLSNPRPRSTATLRDEDPRDREKFFTESRSTDARRDDVE